MLRSPNLSTSTASDTDRALSSFRVGTLSRFGPKKYPSKMPSLRGIARATITAAKPLARNEVVKGASPTSSGLQLLPLMAGLLLTSTLSGILISRGGRYKVFPIVGTALMTIGMYLLSHLGVTTSTLAASVYMFVLGVGIGAVMQVLVIAVQNVVSYTDLGVATSGATFYRSIGGSFGTAAFGAIFANQLTGNLARYLAGTPVPAGFNASAGASPAVLAKLPPGRPNGNGTRGVAHRTPHIAAGSVTSCSWRRACVTASGCRANGPAHSSMSYRSVITDVIRVGAAVGWTGR
jgi:hypothetical protein